MMATLCSAITRTYRIASENGFLPDMAELETLVTPNTKLLLINTRLNPIGSVIPRARMIELLEFAAAHDLWLICDEAYDALIYSDTFVSAAALGHRERVIGVYSFSKTYAMTDWRIGYMVVPRDIAPALINLQEAMTSCASTPGQWAALAALEGPQEAVTKMRDAYAARRQLALDCLSQYGIPAHAPDGAFYLWIDIRAADMPSRDFARTLLDDHKVAIVPGLDFGPGGEGYVRASLAAAPEAIQAGLERIGQYLDTYLMRTSLNYLADIGVERIAAHARELGGALRRDLIRLGLSVTTPEAPEARAGNICFTHPNADQLMALAAEDNILIWSDSGRVRLSVHVFVDTADITHFLNKLPEYLAKTG